MGIHRLFVVPLLATCLLVACDSLSLENIATPARDARAQRVLLSFVAGERDSALAHARFGSDSAATVAGLAQLDSVLRGRRVDSLRIIGANKWTMGDAERLTLSYEMRTERGWLGATVTTVDSAGSWALLGVHAESIPGELEAINNFQWTGRGLSQYFGLLLVLVCTVISIGMAVFLATRRAYPKRWRWVLLSLVGTSGVYVNWTSGEVWTRLFTMQLFSASVLRPSVFAPWILSFSFPIGALFAWERYRRWQRHANVPPTQPTSVDAAPTSEVTV